MRLLDAVVAVAIAIVSEHRPHSVGRDAVRQLYSRSAVARPRHEELLGERTSYFEIPGGAAGVALTRLKPARRSLVYSRASTENVDRPFNPISSPFFRRA